MTPKDEGAQHSFHDLAEEIRKETDELMLSDLIDKDTLQVIQDSFVEATGMVAGIFDNEFNSIIPNSQWSDFCTMVDGAAHGKCLEADAAAVEEAKSAGKPVLHKCFACSTAFFAAPIIIQDRVMGSILCGQVRTESPNEESVKELAREISVDEMKLVEAANDLKVYPEPTLEAWGNLLQSIANLVAELGHERAISHRIEETAEERSVQMEHTAKSLEETIQMQTGELRVSEIMYKNLFDQSNDAIFVHTLDGKTIDLNSRAEELLGYSKEELMSISIPDLHTEETKAESREAFARIREERSVRFESEMVRKDGTVIPVEISSRFFQTDGDELIQGVVRDISERARFISLLKSARDVLQEKVAERTAALTTSKRELEKKVRDLEHWEDMLFEKEMVISKLEDEVKRLRQTLAQRPKREP
jgi:PAS domain S-box-containing protein